MTKEQRVRCIAKEITREWQPMLVPVPPVEEESALVKELRKEANAMTNCATAAGIHRAIAIVKRHEKVKK